LMTMAGRLAKLNIRLEEDQQKELKEAAQGKELKVIINELLDSVDPDKHIEKAREMFDVQTPSDYQTDEAIEKLTTDACRVFDDPEFRNTLIEIRRQQYQIIDTVSQDAIISVGMDTDQAEEVITSFKEFIKENKDEILALQIIYNKPHEKRHLTYEMIKKLANAMKKPPYNLNTENVWRAYEQLEKDKVKKRRPEFLLADIISLVRFGLEKENILTPFQDTVEMRFADWLVNQEKTGNSYTEEQIEWLNMIKDHITTSLEITVDDFDNVPFYERGGVMKASEVFGERFDGVLEELNEVLVA